MSSLSISQPVHQTKTHTKMYHYVWQKYEPEEGWINKMEENAMRVGGIKSLIYSYLALITSCPALCSTEIDLLEKPPTPDLL